MAESHPSPPSPAKDETRNKAKCFDWLSHPEDFDLTDYQKLTLAVDWNATAVSIPTQCPHQLRSMVLTVFKDPNPACVYWGNAPITAIYNQPHSVIIGHKHPDLLGHDPGVWLRELWGHFAIMLEQQRQNGEVCIASNSMHIIQRHGFVE